MSVDNRRPTAAPTTALPSGPASRLRLWNEIWTVRQPPRLVLRAPRLARMPRGDGAPVVDLPGWRSPEMSMVPLRRYLRYLGYDARAWGIGLNRGDPEADARRLVPMVRDLADQHGRKVALVGWSLGGVVAREIARSAPDDVSAVITFGSPIIGGPVFTPFTPTWSEERRQAMIARIQEHERANPLTCPVTAIYSRSDAVVRWKATLDHHSADVRHVEVRSSHLGMGVDPDVWEVVARALHEYTAVAHTPLEHTPSEHTPQDQTAGDRMAGRR
jgi:pimeloyl-ACP methyl ester carboxylesterase